MPRYMCRAGVSYLWLNRIGNGHPYSTSCRRWICPFCEYARAVKSDHGCVMQASDRIANTETSPPWEQRENAKMQFFKACCGPPTHLQSQLFAKIINPLWWSLHQLWKPIIPFILESFDIRLHIMYWSHVTRIQYVWIDIERKIGQADATSLQTCSPCFFKNSMTSSIQILILCIKIPRTL